MYAHQAEACSRPPNTAHHQRGACFSFGNGIRGDGIRERGISLRGSEAEIVNGLIGGLGLVSGQTSTASGVGWSGGFRAVGREARLVALDPCHQVLAGFLGGGA
jgi:hypothetical protein